MPSFDMMHIVVPSDELFFLFLSCYRNFSMNKADYKSTATFVLVMNSPGKSNSRSPMKAVGRFLEYRQ